MIALRILSVALGALVVGLAVGLAVRTFMVPRSDLNIVSRLVLRAMQHLFWLLVAPLRSWRARDAVLGLYAPVCLLTIVLVTMAAIGLGNVLVFWGLGVPSLRQAFIDSGSSLTTLGFAELGDDLAIVLVAVVEAAAAATTLALLIGYLPTVYAAYQQREQAVAALAAQVGDAVSGVAILVRYARPPGLLLPSRIWDEWTRWFVTLGGSHSTLTGILFVRSPRPDQSWVTTAGAILDAAALTASTVDGPVDPEVDRCLATGVRALHQILDTLRLPFPSDPSFPETPISITRAELHQACVTMERAGIRLKADREDAWQGFARLRVRYDGPLIALCRLTMVPEAPWSSDRPEAKLRLPLPIRRLPVRSGR